MPDHAETNLVPGEDLDHPSLEDAEHWVEVYDELARALQELMRSEFPSSQRTKMEHTLARYVDRRNWWLERRRDAGS